MSAIIGAIFLSQFATQTPAKPAELTGLDKILATESYILPPKAIMDSVLAPWNENVSISNIDPSKTRYLRLRRPLLVPISVMARPVKILGGIDIELSSGRNKDIVNRAVTSFEIVNIRDGKSVTVTPDFPLGVSTPTWSGDGTMLAFWGFRDAETWLCVADAQNGKVRVLNREQGRPSLITGVEWVDDNKSIVAPFAVPGKAPIKPEVADRPVVRVSDDQRTALRTYQGLLNDEHDASMLEFYSTVQLQKVDVKSGRSQKIGTPAAYRSLSPSPDGRSFQVSITKRPYSYLVPASSFGSTTRIMDESGKELIKISDTNLRVGAPAAPPAAAGGQLPAGNNTERRSMGWRPDGAGLSYLQLAPREEGSSAPQEDQVVLWKYPFGDNDKEVVYKTTGRIGSVQYTRNPRKIVISQTAEGKATTTLVNLDDESKNVVLFERAGAAAAPGGGRRGGAGAPPTTPAAPQTPQDDPIGSLITTDGPKTGTVVLLSSNEDAVFFTGRLNAKDPKESDRQWIEKYDLATKQRTRIFEAKGDGIFETATGIDSDMNDLLVTRQSVSRVPNTYLINRAEKTDRAITNNRDYNPEITQADRRVVKVTRADGMSFEVRVTVPRGFRAGDKRPSIFWFYPGEFVDQAAYDASKRNVNPNLFRQPSASNVLHFLKLGYVVVEPDCPIFAPADRKNDSYIPQLRNNLSATIDELSDQGFIDRKKLALGGHSYGAFSTANAMVHTPFFKAGIAGDGAYNRMLTPFGFQSENRMLWESREVYLTMSPMLYAEQLTGALLMYHGIEDQNMGTWPLNSERMFQALEALGKPSALYMYPYEDHGQIAHETRLDMWARWVAWLEKWVEGKK